MLDSKSVAQYLYLKLGESLYSVPELISSTNNIVYKANSRSGRAYAIKCVTDPGLDVDFLLRTNRILQRTVRTQEIISADTSKSVLPFEVIVSRYYEGISIAELVETGGMTSSLEMALAEFLFQIMESVKEVPIPNTGFGIYKKNREMFDTWASFIEDYIDRYVGRLAVIDSEEPWNTWKEHLVGFAYSRFPKIELLNILPVSLDTNLKNFLYLPESKEFVLLNVPLVAVTDQRHGIAEIASQLCGSQTRQKFLNMILQSYQHVLDDWQVLAFYEVLSLVGVLAHIAGKDVSAVRSAQRWGYPVPLYQTIVDRMHYVTSC